LVIPIPSSVKHQIDMIKNYFKIAFRNLIKHKSRTVINMGGLAIGIVCAVLIFLVIQFEYSYDTYHADTDRIYRMVTKDTQFGNISFNTGVHYPLPEAMRNDFPQVEALTIVDANIASEAVLSSSQDEDDARRIREEFVAFVHPDYFELFTYAWLSGDRRSALTRPNTVVISRSIAKKLFGTANPMGRTLTVQTSSKYDLEVTGVVEDPPPNTDMPFTVLVTYSSVSRSGEPRGSDNWDSTSSSVQCYVKLPEGMNPETVNARMDAFIEKYRDEERTRWIDYFLQPLSEIHFDTRFGNYRGKVVPREMLMAFGMIGLFLLIAACINFINLNTAVAVTRSKEVGVRKALGGTRGQLAVHFMGETALVTLLSFVMALGVAEIAVHYLEPVLGYTLELDLFANGLLALFIAGLFIATTLLAGLYPALYLSGFNPIDAIRNRISSSYGEGLTLRRTLVIVQFTISQLLIIGTVVISTQMEYFRTADMGFDDEAVVEVDIPVRDESQLEIFKNRLSGHTAIKSAAFSNTGTAHGNTWGGNFKLVVGDSLVEGDAQIKFIEPEFIDTYGLNLLAGSNLISSDSVTQYLVNEEFARRTGYGNRYRDLIGRRVEMWGREAPIVGVIRDFNTNSLHREIEPVLLAVRNSYYLAGIKIALDRSREAIDVIRQAYNAAFPEYVFDYLFLNTRIENFYKKERQMARVMNWFTAIAVAIGCLGLFGLVSYMAATRRKEVSIRKVLGATLSDILLLFSREFFLLVGLSFLIAAPLAWIAMNRWLADFAYRIELGPGLFVLAFAATLVIAVATVGFKSLRTASLNPVENLNSE